MFLSKTANEYGTPVAEMRCDACGQIYTICPIPEDLDNWQECMAPECKSYDPSRDMDWMFQDDPKVTPIRRPWRSA